ncbi:MAG: ABC transporter ATP-binding protein [Verrucomicrobiota bacterium]
MPAALTVKDLKVTFRQRRSQVEAVRGCSIKIHSGEVLSLVGESGSGKSQLSLACLGLTPGNGEVTGSICLGSEEIVGKPREVIRQMRGSAIAMISQNPMTALNPFFRVGDQLCEILRAHHDLDPSEARARILEAFKEVALPNPEGAIDRFPHQFSGGQLQRIMIALAVSCRAKVLIADEPTTALDMTTQAQILELLRKLVDEHQIALLFITHDIGAVTSLADRVAVMRQGEIVERGTLEDVTRNPQHEYTQQLMDAVPILGAGKITPPVPDSISEDGRDNAPAILRVRGLTKVYPSKAGPVKALDEVDFQILPGECTALVGESGSGKTTLAMSLLHLLKPSGGVIRFEGKEISKATGNTLKEARRNISVVFQNPYSSLNPRMRVIDIVSEPLRVLTDLDNQEIKQRVLSALESVGLSHEHLSRFPHAFSGGQRQRIALARAFVLEPKLIILDEPTAALDVSVQASVVELLNELRERTNAAFLFITHDLALVEQVANRVIVLYKGQIVERGPVSKVFKEPEHEYTERLLQSTPRFERV